MDSIILLLLASFLSALIVVAAIVAVGGAVSIFQRKLFNYLMVLLTVASIGDIIFSQRIIQTVQQGLEIISEAGIASNILAKILLILVIGSSFSVCITWFLGRRNAYGRRTRFPKYIPPTDIMIAFMFFYVAFSIFPIFFGEKYYFHVSLIYPFFVYLALFLTFDVLSEPPENIFKLCLSIVVFGSLLSSVIFPDFAVQTRYAGLIPGFQQRLWGLTAHPNSLGAVASVLLILEIAKPAERRWLHRTVVIGAVVALLLSQSKTSIASALLGLATLLAWRFQASVRSSGVTLSTSPTWRNLAAIGGMLALLVLAWIWVMFFDISITSLLGRRLNPNALGAMTTATGRTWIWAIALQAGLENPLFGQGADFWGLATRLKYGLNGAINAHNLFLQVFSRSGFVGLFSLFCFLYFLVRYSIRAASVTRGASLALMVLFFFRAMFEVPIQPNSILGAEFFTTMAYIFYVMDRGARLQKSSTSSISQKAKFGHIPSRNWVVSDITRATSLYDVRKEKK